MIALDVAHEVQVPLERDVRVVSTLDPDLNPAKGLRLLDLGADLLERERVALTVFGTPIERAKPQSATQTFV